MTWRWPHATLPTDRSGFLTILAITRMSTSQEHIPFLDYIGLEIDEWRDGHAAVGLEIKPHHLNRAGVVHGGVYAVLADAAGGLAGCFSGDLDQRILAYTVSLTTNFLASAQSGRLLATGTVMRSGRRVFFSNIDIGCSGRRVAIAQGSFMLVDRAPGDASGK